MIISKTKQGDVPEKRSQAHTAYISSYSLLQRPKHQVFLSFGEDVRKTFVSYLIMEFKWIGIAVVYSGFMRGKSMSLPEVTQAIKESSISVVVISKDYVSSSKCLDELVEILRWREETWGNRVMPIYYEMSPYDLKKQTKTIGNRLVETYLGKVEMPELRWMRALTYIVNIVGESSEDWFVFQSLCIVVNISIRLFWSLKLLCTTLKLYETYELIEDTLERLAIYRTLLCCYYSKPFDRKRFFFKSSQG